MGEEIAVIGLSCRFPHSPTPKKFWDNLFHGKELITYFSDEELLLEGGDPSLFRLPTYVKAKGMLENIDRFDAAFFGYSGREAACMDPQQRIMLECAWEALEVAGYPPELCEGQIGVFASCSLSTYFCFNLFPHLIHSPLQQDEMLMIMGTEKDFLPTRISYKLNLKGPSKCIQTACSSSLVAVHDACQSLLNHESDLALAGGISITCPQKNGYLYTKEGINSPDGHCRAFDSHAAGTLIGNGGGLVLLKRFDEAVADGDTIRAIIKGSAVNNDGGRKVGYTAPSIEGQAQVILSAQLAADVHPETITYIEAHGTGTILGDPVEVAALTKAFWHQTQSKQYCRLGSVKTNIGHLDAAAGIAGLIKTILSLENQQIPASLNFENPNPAIAFAETPFYVNSHLSPWLKQKNQPLRAGVSSFGIGGTNAHLILEEAPPQGRSPSKYRFFLLPFSAKNDIALRNILTNFLAALPVPFPLADIAFTLQVGRTHFEKRICFVAQSIEEAALLINDFLTKNDSSLKLEPISRLQTTPESQLWIEIGKKWLMGENEPWKKAHEGEKRCRIPLPTYPFLKERHWINPRPLFASVQSNPERDHSSEFNSVEEILINIWKNSLKVETLGIDEDFFALGGDSLIALEIIDQIRKKLDVEISLRDIFENRTIRKLGAVVEQEIVQKVSRLTEEEAEALLEKLNG